MATLSVSKGVFAFKRRVQSPTKQKKKSKSSGSASLPYWPGNDSNTSSMQQKHFQKCWAAVHEKLKSLESNIHEAVFKELVQFVASQSENKDGSKSKQSHIVESRTEAGGMPAAVLVMGVNMPDSQMVLASLEHQLVQGKVASRVVSLNSRNCSTLKHCIISLADLLINGSCAAAEEASEDDISSDEELSPRKRKKKDMRAVKKNCLSMTALDFWYKEQKEKGLAGSIVVLVEGVESFPTSVLESFIQVVSEHQRSLPLVLVLCVATSPAALHSCLSQRALACLSITTFQARPSHSYLATLVDEVVMDSTLPSFRLGGKALRLLLDMFLYHHLSVNSFVQGFKYCMLEHFLSSPVSVLCCSPQDRQKVLDELKASQLNAIRKLPSFRQYVDSLAPKEKAPLLIDDEHFKRRVLSLLSDLDKYYNRLCILLRLLHPIAAAAPDAPLGRQLWSLLSLSLNGSLGESEEVQQLMEHLRTVSREELLAPLPAALCALAGTDDADLLAAGAQLQELLDELLRMDDVPAKSPSKNGAVNAPKLDSLLPTDRFKLKEKLQEMALQKKQHQSQPNKFVSLRSKVVDIIENLLKEFGVPPSSIPLNEVLFFNNTNLVANGLSGKHRSSITKALADPAYYLECECCADSQDCLSPSLPDISIAYRLHLECGRLINLYDWLQAFCACVEHPSLNGHANGVQPDHNSVKKRKEAKHKSNERTSDEPQPELQARFVQAVSELQFLGFIKASKRKTDHVARLTWGGC